MQEIGDLEKKQKVRDKYVVDIPVIFLHYYSVFTFGKDWIHDLELSGNLELTHQVKVLSIRQLQQLDFQKGTWRLLSELGWTFWNRLFGGNYHWSKVRCLVNQNWEVWMHRVKFSCLDLDDQIALEKYDLKKVPNEVWGSNSYHCVVLQTSAVHQE